MKDTIVTTMPIKPQENISIGMCIAPFLSEIVSQKIETPNIFSINLLHSYENKDFVCANYINALKEIGIKFNKVFIDKENLLYLKKSVYDLYEKGIIVERNSNIVRCKCGKIDIVKEGIRNFENGDLYYRKGDVLYCKECNSVCKEYKENQLYLYLNPKICDYTKITPNFLQAELNHFYKMMPGKYILVSKNRNTDCQIQTNNKTYNIDNDLLWMNYIQCFNEKNEILIASNHQLYEMYILNYINNMSSKKNLNFIATPYMKKSNFDINQEFNKYDDVLYKKLSLLYSLKWKNKDCTWNKSIFKGIAKLGGIKREILYNDIIESKISENFNIEEYLNYIFLKEINMQDNVNSVKKKSLT